MDEEKDLLKTENLAENELGSATPNSKLKPALILSRIGLILSVIGVGVIFSLFGLFLGLANKKIDARASRYAVAMGLCGIVLSILFATMITVCAILIFKN